MAKYDKYIANPPHRQIKAHDDGRIVIDGLWVNKPLTGQTFTIGHQFARKTIQIEQPVPHA